MSPITIPLVCGVKHCSNSWEQVEMSVRQPDLYWIFLHWAHRCDLSVCETTQFSSGGNECFWVIAFREVIFNCLSCYV